VDQAMADAVIDFTQSIFDFSWGDDTFDEAEDDAYYAATMALMKAQIKRQKKMSDPTLDSDEFIRVITVSLNNEGFSTEQDSKSPAVLDHHIKKVALF
jgi:hypothetical protein